MGIDNEFGQPQCCNVQQDLTPEQIKKKRENEEKGGFVLAVAFIGLVALLLIIIFTVKNQPEPVPLIETYEYNGFMFTKIDNTWFSEGQVGATLLNINFRHDPRSLEDIPVTGDLNKFQRDNPMLYLTFNPEASNHSAYVTMSFAETSQQLVSHFGKDIAAGCIMDHPDCTSMEVKTITCADATNGTGVVFIKNGGEPSVTLEDNCVTITGTDEDLVRASNRFMYGIYGIMQN